MKTATAVIGVCLLLLAVAAVSPGGNKLAAQPSKETRHRLILCNDGGTLVGPSLEAPMGVEGLVRLTIDRLQGTQVDTLYWQLGTDPYHGTPTHRLSDIYSHRTRVGPRWGEGGDRFANAGEWRIYENARAMMQRGTDPVAVVIDYGHQAGLQVFVSMRVNDTHDSRLPGQLNDPLMSPMKRRNPHWLLKADGWAKTSYNYALPEVRAYRLALAEEAIANYDLDGLDWDFCRFKPFFPAEPGPETEKYTPLLTEVLREIKAALDKKGRQVGRKVYFSVRVPGSLQYALSYGLDVKTWLNEGLIDVIIVGQDFGNRHRLPVEEYVEAAWGSDVEVIAQNLGLFMQPRPWSAKVLWNERDYYSAEMCRATAANHWRAGADGIYLFNNHLIEFARDSSYDRGPWKEIADPDLIARKDKHYLVDQKKWSYGPLHGPLPVYLDLPGDGAQISVDIADDLASAAQDGVLKEVTLRLLIEQLTALDKLAFQLNGKVLDAASARKRLLYNDYWLDFDVFPPLLKQGWNQLNVKVKSRNPRISAKLNLRSVEVLVRYRTGEDRP